MKPLHTYVADAYSDAFEEETCTKFCGTVTVEEIRRRLKRSGIPVSRQGVYIRNVPIEIDLLIPRPGARPSYHGLVYEPQDVLAALEIKYLGMFPGDGITRLQNNFGRIRAANKGIVCAYLTVCESVGYKHAVTTKTLGYPAYTLFWYAKSDHKPSGDWAKLVDRLKRKLGIGPSHLPTSVA